MMSKIGEMFGQPAPGTAEHLQWQMLQEAIWSEGENRYFIDLLDSEFRSVFTRLGEWVDDDRGRAAAVAALALVARRVEQTPENERVVRGALEQLVKEWAQSGDN
jgi:hypothetical protein